MTHTHPKPATGIREVVSLLFGLVLVLGLCGALYFREVGQTQQRLYDRETARVLMLARLAQTELRPVANDLRGLADGDGLRAYLVSGAASDLARSVHRAVFFSLQTPEYDQIRYLDENGHERLRVEQDGRVIAEDQLQDKSDRPYFKKTATLAAGQIYISAFDLNVEHGQVEVPFKPTLRYAAPVFDATGRRRGAYVLNFLGSGLLKHLQEAIPSSGQRFRVLNPQGYWIKAAKPAQEWGFMFPDRAGFTLAKTDPALWEKVSQEHEGQVRHEGGLFTWQRISPVDFTYGDNRAVKAEEDFLIIASEVSAQEWSERFSGIREIFLIVTPGLILLVATTSWFSRARKRAVMTLRRNEESLTVTLHSIGDGVLATDTAGKITRMNRVAQELTGWTQADALGRPIAEVFRIIKEETREPALMPVDDVLSTGEIHGLANHTVLVSRAGKEYAIADSAAPIRDRDGRIIGVVLVFRDVSAERAAAIKLAAAREDFDRFFTLSLDFLCISSSDGYFRRVSPAVTDILGWTVDEFLSRPFTSFVHPDDVAATMREVERQVVHGEKVLQFENRYLHRDGTWRTLSWRSVPQPGGLMYATARDVTDLKRTEGQIRKLNTELQGQAAQLTAANQELESFSYSVSHDLRAPLRHIQGFVQMLAREIDGVLTEKSRHYLKTIAQASSEMGQLIDDLLSFSQMGRSEMRDSIVDLEALLHETRRALDSTVQARNINWKIGELPKVQGDLAMLRQVFANLLSNAIKYSRDRNPAEIEVGCEGMEEGRRVFFVRDNGAGFDMQYAGKLFGVFQRLHRAEEFEGTGIGLANVKRIITRHGGRIWAEGAVNAGATIYFTLKLAPAN